MTQATTAAPSSRSLRALLDRGAPSGDIASFLDALSPGDRVAEVMGIGGAGVGRLYDACAGAPTLEPEDFVPGKLASETTVIFEGRNSLPTFTRFQKRFARLKSGEVVGYNHQTWAFVTGPGFFVVKPPSPRDVVADELYFDYTSDPASVPAGWPSFKPNARGFSRLVYAHMKDYIRRVAEGVVVGKAYKNGKAQGAYFSLARAD